jgi:glucose/mannose-6-phosphate isomerase
MSGAPEELSGAPWQMSEPEEQLSEPAEQLSEPAEQRSVPDPLDDPAVAQRLDPEDMLGAIASLPEQLTAAWQRSRALQLPVAYRGLSSVLVLGVGGSAIGADLVRCIFADRLRVPLITVRDYTLPAFAGPTTLAIASSHSGATEETLAAFERAAAAGCRLAAIASGGTLLSAARAAGLPLLESPPGGQPRAAVGWGTVLLAGLLERAGLLDLDGPQIEAAAAAARAMVGRCAPHVPTADNPAKRLAWSFVDRVPVVEAGGFLAPVARRWKTQLNENGKSMAVFEELPEATHNAVVGYAQPESAHERTIVVFLVSPDDHPRLAQRAALSAQLLDERRIMHETVVAAGEGRLAQAFSTIVLGDFAAVYLAFLYGLDPTPVAAIAWLKERLAATGAPAGAG